MVAVVARYVAEIITSVRAVRLYVFRGDRVASPLASTFVRDDIAEELSRRVTREPYNDNNRRARRRFEEKPRNYDFRDVRYGIS